MIILYIELFLIIAELIEPCRHDHVIFLKHPYSFFFFIVIVIPPEPLVLILLISQRSQQTLGRFLSIQSPDTQLVYKYIIFFIVNDML